jgi:hypothetical protein
VRTLSAVAAKASGRRPEMTTVHPSAARASAPAWPIPLAPPVTHAIRFVLPLILFDPLAIN